jgi:hypothetical protein
MLLFYFVKKKSFNRRSTQRYKPGLTDVDVITGVDVIPPQMFFQRGLY